MDHDALILVIAKAVRRNYFAGLDQLQPLVEILLKIPVAADQGLQARLKLFYIIDRSLNNSDDQSIHQPKLFSSLLSCFEHASYSKRADVTRLLAAYP